MHFFGHLTYFGIQINNQSQEKVEEYLCKKNIQVYKVKLNYPHNKTDLSNPSVHLYQTSKIVFYF